MSLDPNRKPPMKKLGIGHVPANPYAGRSTTDLADDLADFMRDQPDAPERMRLVPLDLLTAVTARLVLLDRQLKVYTREEG